MPSVFFLGATGYIGGAVLARLLQEITTLSVTALVRNSAHISAIEALGVHVIQGSFEDKDVIAQSCYSADIVINAADSDNVDLISTILCAIKRKYDKTGRASPFVHTSGVAVCLDDGVDGTFDNKGRIWDDMNEDDIKSISPKSIHGNVDTRVLEASAAGYIQAYIMCPGAIVGPSTGPIQNGSFFLKFLTQLYTSFRGAFYVGEGSNEFQVVQLTDVVDFYVRIVQSVLSGSHISSPYARYFFLASNPVSWKDIATSVGGALAKLGVLAAAEPRTILPAEMDNTLVFLGASQRITAQRAKALGWSPHHVNLADYTDDSIREIIAAQKIMAAQE